MPTNSGTRTLSNKYKPGSHDDLNARFSLVGEKLVSLAMNAKGSAGNTITSQHNLNLTEIFESQDRLKNKNWGSYYRSLAPGQDELVSTSSVRELIKGVKKADGQRKLSPQKMMVLNEFFNQLSELRFPTEWSGHNNSDSQAIRKGFMQHPTQKGKEMWKVYQRKGDGGNHFDLDLKRKEAILVEMEESLRKKSDLKTVLNAAANRAISFTLNEFTAPASARDQYPARHVREEVRIRQTGNREALKNLSVSRFGGTQETGEHSMDREYGNRKGKRALSPPRTRPENTQATLSDKKRMLEMQEPNQFSSKKQRTNSGKLTS